MTTPTPVRADQPRPRLPLPPFDNSAADTVLRSSDGILLHVHSVIVAEASEVFAGMYSIPQPPRLLSVGRSGGLDQDRTVDGGGAPVVQLAEDGLTLDRLLRLCYPIADPEFKDPAEIRPVLAAAIKYEMNEAVSLTKKALLSYIPTRPLEVWAVACSLQLEDETLEAARALASGPVYFTSTALEALREVSVGQYWRLMKFICRGGNAGTGFSFWHPEPEDAPQDSRLVGSRTYSTIEFVDRPFADIICRSFDGQDFRSHKAILITVSPVLRERILALEAKRSGSGTNTNGSDNIPVLQFHNPATELSALLELSYPVRRNSCFDVILPLHRVCALMKAAKTYAMDFVLKVLEPSFHAEAYASPLKAYLLAKHMGLAEYAREMEPTVLRREPHLYGWFPEMETIRAPAFYELVMKHHAHSALGSDIFAALHRLEGSDADSQDL
ncbi:hypothetical protein BN946_scf185008.g106 [Trametes cinnabarina]|uniref:BTB domain-containing protein n=1 Tax=Pycnoporus cinnabarinus TaxID=5643 RepID=A0A060SLP9_PYCCI|nr:hypothetical protein BN946_scf185008.g106 [Trametes cinnabarina]